MDKHVETELLAYLDDELNSQDKARVEAHLAHCPRCTQALEELRDLQAGLDVTFDTALTPIHLPQAADNRIRQTLHEHREPRRLWARLWQRRLVLAQAMLAVLVLFFSLNSYWFFTLRPTEPIPETLVLGQNQFAPGSQAALRVIVRCSESAIPLAGAQIAVSLSQGTQLATTVYQGLTDNSGSAEVSFKVPEDMSGKAELMVTTETPRGAKVIIHPITIQRAYKLYITSDKPLYEPGQTLHMRTLALNAINLKAVAEENVKIQVLNPGGQIVYEETVTTSAYGIATLDWPIANTTPKGAYTLQATLGDTVSKRTITINTYQRPPFRVELTTSNSYYLTGAMVTGNLHATYFFGKPVANADVILRGYAETDRRMPFFELTGKTDTNGNYDFVFELPTYLGLDSDADTATSFEIEAVVIDQAGQDAGVSTQIPVAERNILIHIMPESGVLKMGVENLIYIYTAYPDGTPVEANLLITAEAERVEIKSDVYGLATFSFTPRDPSRRVEVRAKDEQGQAGRAVLTLEADTAPQLLLLRAERATYTVGETLKAEALVPARTTGPVYLDIVQAGQMVATQAEEINDGRATFALDLDGTLLGALELHAYVLLEDGGRVEDNRTVVVDPPSRLDVNITAGQASYHPGESATLNFETTRNTGEDSRPQQAALGIAIVDESVYALETLPPGFARAYVLAGNELLKMQSNVSSLNLPSLLNANPAAREAQDLAAQAAWANIPKSQYSIFEIAQIQQQETLTAQKGVAYGLSISLLLIPLALSVVVLRGLDTTGTRKRALRRAGIGGIIFGLSAPVVIPVMAGILWLLWAVLNAWTTLLIIAAIALLAGIGFVHGVHRHDTRVQIAMSLLVAYLVLGGLLAIAAAQVDIGLGLAVPLALLLLVMVGMFMTLGQGLIVEGWKYTGWLLTLLGLMLIPLALSLSVIPALRSELTQTLGNPNLYTGPVGWLTGCSAGSPDEVMPSTMEQEEPATEGVIEEHEDQQPAPMPTAAMTDMPLPVEPAPLRQIFPDTLYWNPEAITNEDGSLSLGLPLADSITTWRVTALASTEEGDLGVGTYDLRVFQDFFIDLQIPEAITLGVPTEVTVMVYNYLPETQNVSILPQNTHWYTLLSQPGTIMTEPNTVTTATLEIQPEKIGTFALKVVAQGEQISDAVAIDVEVKP
ncbi:MAG: zf-HC2 domain-containing protein [Anaerolineae bacterium]|nr:zf-HC2 domain-containing protein [Anaerolineae bacterium]